MLFEAKLLSFRKFLTVTLFAPSGAARSAAHDYEMSIRAAAAKLLHNGRLLLRSTRANQNNRQCDVVDGFSLNILPKRGSAAEKAVGTSSPAPVGGRGASVVRNVAYKFHQHARRLFVDNVLRRVTNSQSAELRERATKRLLFGDSAPFFALVGVSIASGTGILTKDDELEGICWEIREAVSKLQWSMSQLQSNACHREDLNTHEHVSGLNDLDVGPVIAKGCSAVVYAAKLEDVESKTNEDQEQNHTVHDPLPHKCAPTDVSKLAFPLALKMMFNYDAESNAAAILRAMYRETVPAPHHLVFSLALDGDTEWDSELASRVRRLPPHPNIVEILGLFADRIPFLPGSLSLYPDALPARLNPEGSGRNMSLFLLMKRYDTSLKQYLEQHSPSVREATLLLTQLLEAVTHMTRHEVAHRDLKSDNLLLTLLGPEDGENEELPCPLLAVTDFGCCLADASHGLSMPYHSPETDRGGNTALMAPEVACARVGPFSSISYSKSDAWACGALAYELFCGGRNPFYANWRVEAPGEGDDGGGGGEALTLLPPLKSRSYREDQLPPLPANVPPLVAAVVAGLLTRSPHKRLSAEMAATVLQLHLWAPSAWLGTGEEGLQKPTSNEILQWLLCLATKVLCEGGLGLCVVGGRRTLAEYRLISSLLSRASLHRIKAALAWAVAATTLECY